VNKEKRIVKRYGEFATQIFIKYCRDNSQIVRIRRIFMKKVAIYTLGCKVNQYESDAMYMMFRDNNYEMVDFEDEADIYVINTCTVTGTGDKKSRQVIRRARRKNPEALVVVTGCLAQVWDKEGVELPEVNLIVGNQDRKNIIEIIEKYEGDTVKEISDIMKQREFWEAGEVLSRERTRAYVKIQDGCDRFCSYCIIPYARGPVRSRNLESIKREVVNLVENGFKEIVLTGIHIASYGKDLRNITLLDVLKALDEIEGLERIRLGSIEPNFINEESIEVLKNMKKLCKHFHLSLQSGNNDTLKRMNRGYTIEEFEEKVNLLRQAFDNPALTTDIIVGFPGETEEEFRRTYEFLDRIEFSRMHVFPYSKRVGTPAAIMENQISENIKNERVKLLTEMSDRNELAFAKEFMGKEIEVIFEHEVKDKQNVYEGYTDRYVKVLAKGVEIGTLTKVKVKDINEEIMALIKG